MFNNFKEDEELDDGYHLVQRCPKRQYDAEAKRINGEIYKRKIRQNFQTKENFLEEYLSLSLFEYRDDLNEIKQDMANRGVPIKKTDIFPQLQVADFKNVARKYEIKNVVAKYKGGELKDSHSGVFNIPTDDDFCFDLGKIASDKYYK